MKYLDFSDVIVDRAISAETQKQDFYKLAGKRVFDVVFALLLLPLLLPIIAVLWAVTAIKDGGNGFFGHVRVGKGGQEFRCWKIRTMVVGAQGKLET